MIPIESEINVLEPFIMSKWFKNSLIAWISDMIVVEINVDVRNISHLLDAVSDGFDFQVS